MPKHKLVDFRVVKSAITMEQVLQHYGLLDSFKRSGDSLSGPCPLHGGTNPTQFRVSISKNVWNCFSECKHGGNVLDFVAEKESITVHAAALKLIGWFQLSADKSPEDEPEPAAPPPQRSLPVAGAKAPAPARSTGAETGENKPLGFQLQDLKPEHPYLTGRGLTRETLVDFGVGFCGKGMLKDRIAIPIHNLDGKVVAYAGRWPGEPPDAGTPKYKLPPGFKKSLELFNLDRAKQVVGPLVIVEGFFDCMTLWQHGVKRVVALMGSTLSSAQEELIRRHTDQHSQVIVLLDEDDAGRAGREQLAVRLSRFVFVKTHVFEQEGRQPSDLSAEEAHAICGGAP